MYFQHNILLHATARIVPHGVFLSIQGVLQVSQKTQKTIEITYC